MEDTGRYERIKSLLEAPMSNIYQEVYSLILDEPDHVLGMSVEQVLGIYSLVRENLGPKKGEKFLTSSLEMIADAARRMDELAEASSK